MAADRVVEGGRVRESEGVREAVLDAEEATLGDALGTVAVRVVLDEGVRDSEVEAETAGLGVRVADAIEVVALYTVLGKPEPDMVIVKLITPRAFALPAGTTKRTRPIAH